MTELQKEWLRERIAIHCADAGIAEDGPVPLWIIRQQTEHVMRHKEWDGQKEFKIGGTTK